MKKIITAVSIMMMLAGCVSVDIQDDVSKTMVLDIPGAPNAIAGVSVPPFTIEQSKDADFSDIIKSFKNIANVNISISDNKLTIQNGNFYFYDHISLSLDNSSGLSVVLTDHYLTFDERNASIITLPITSSQDLYPILSSGPINVHYIFTMSGNVSTDQSILQASITLHADIKTSNILSKL